MKRLVAAVVMVMVAATVWGAEPADESASAVEQGMADFDRNVALGAILEVRPGTPAELGDLQLSADRGLERARDLVAGNPDSADAHYLLGSWLLYAYGVVEVEQITYDAQSGAKTETVSRAMQGLADDPEEGLRALRKAAELAPENGDYVLGLAAALFDFGDAFEAQGILKGVWVGEPELEAGHKIEAALLLSAVAEAEGDTADAREWIYAALSLDPIGARTIEQLRRLDAAEVAAAQAAVADAVEQALAQAYAEQYEGAEEEYYEGTYDEGDLGDEQYEQE